MSATDTTPGPAAGKAVFAAESRWIRRAPRADAKARLVCLPFAGGGASVFQKLPALLPDTIEVVAVQPPGREDRSREDPPDDVASLARAVSVALRPYGSVPYSLYGHCAGALLAYEVAYEMSDRFGMRPQRLVAGAQPAPHLPPTETPLHELPDDRLLETVADRGGLPAEIADNPEFTEFLLPVLRADFTLWEQYEFQPRPPLPHPITTVRGREDQLVDHTDAEQWSEHTTAECTDVTVDGGHYFISSMTEEAAGELTDVLLADQ